ncbi:MAG: response regulator [Gemmatimonadetes bacterium]|nr:response regulator [Gemmatimonadota bacterium]
MSRRSHSTTSLTISRWLAALASAAALVSVATLAEAQQRSSGEPSRALATTSYVRRVIDSDDGLPDTQINAIAQTPDGYLWLGTRRGVVRYDGLSFRLYSPEEVPALPTGSINSLSVDAAGRLWIGTARGLVVRERGVFRRIPAAEVPATNVWEVLEDRHGRLWVAGSFGLLRRDSTRFAPVPGIDAFVYSLHEDPAGRVWMAGREFLGSIAYGETAPTVVPATAGERFFDVIGDGAEGIWVGTRRGAWHIDVRDPRAVRVIERLATGDPTFGNEVWTLTRTPTGDLWIGTERLGVLRWDGQHLTSYAQGTTPDPTWWLLTDARGRVWAGTAAGMLRFQRSAFTTFNEGMAPSSTWSVRGDETGTVWAAASDGRVFFLDGQRWIPRLPYAGRNLASSTWPSGDGGMLAVYDVNRVYRLDRQGARDVTQSLGLRGLSVLSIYRDTDGSHWVATDSGVYHAEGGVARPANPAWGLSRTEPPRFIQRDARGRLIIGRPFLTIIDKGVATRYDSTRGLTHHDILAVLPDSDRIWMATADSGLYLLRRDTVVRVGRADPRLGREVLGIAKDDLGHLWLTSSFGLYRVDANDLMRYADDPRTRVMVRGFDRADGLPTTEFNADYQSQLYTDRAGGIWLPTYAGAVRIDPRAVSHDTLPPQVHLERLSVDGTEYPVDAALHLSAHPIRVELTFAATNALVPSRVRAEYRMIGVDTTWRDAGARRTLSFGPLRGGEYRFEARVAGEDGDWNPVVASLALEVPLWPWEYPWFYPVVLALAVAATALALRLRLRSVERREQVLAALVVERTKELEAERASLEARVQARTADLAREFEERKLLEQRLVTAQKLESIGRLAGGVAHEINNSITGVLGFTELAQHGAKGNAELQSDLDEVWKAGRRVADITRQLLAFARRQHTQPIAVQLDVLLAALSRSLQQSVGERVQVSIDDPGKIPAVSADPSQVEQLIFNLVLNARDAMPTGGAATLRLRHVTLPALRTVGDMTLAAGEYVTLEVGDTGVGMDSEVRARLFEPFFTTKEVNRGTGLGLAVCHGIVARHRGAIEVDSAPDAGTRITVWLPAWQGDSKPAENTSGRPVGSETILLVEDETAVRQVASRVLTLLGYRVIEAVDGAAALSLAEKHADDIDVVVTDVMMPHVSGPELVRTLRERFPRLPVVFMSGYAGLDSAALSELATLGPMVAKPFEQDTLAAAVRRELDRRKTPAAARAVPAEPAVPGRYRP